MPVVLVVVLVVIAIAIAFIVGFGRPAGGSIGNRWQATAAAVGVSIGSMPSGAGSAPVGTAKMPAAAAAAAPPGSVEVCGLGWRQPGAEGMVGAEAEATLHLTERRNRLLQRLAASPDAYARAVAAWLQTPGDPAALARMAANSADPRVYSLAFQACRRLPEDAFCKLLSAAQWARLDPGNAAPWLDRLDQAARTGDRSLLEEALHRIATSDRNDVRWGAAVGPVVEAMSTDDAEQLAGLKLVFETIGLQSSMPMPSFQPLLGACRGDAVQRNANRQQSCRAAAELLATGSDSLIAQFIGARLAGELGGPADRLAGMRAELEAYSQYRGSVPGVLGEDPSCSGIRRFLAPLAVAAAVGEVGTVRNWTAAQASHPASAAAAGR